MKTACKHLFKMNRKWNPLTNIKWYVVSDYYYKDAGGVCNDEKDVIRSKTECSKALSELGFEKSGSYYTYYGYPIPSGCSIRTIGFAEANKPHFLESSPGVGKGRNDLIPICKNVSKIGIYFIFNYQIFVVPE